MLNESATLAEEGEDVGGSDTGHSSTLQTPKPSTSRRRPAKDIAELQMSSAFGQLTNMLAKRQKESQQPLKEDECELYGKLLTQKLRELPSDDRKLMMYEIDTLFINRIKEKQRCQAISSCHSVPYQIRMTSPMPNRPSSYPETFPNTSPYLNRPSPSPTSYSEPTILHQPSTYHTTPDLNNATPTIQIISNELIAPQRGQNMINAALLKAYEEFDNCKK